MLMQAFKEELSKPFRLVVYVGLAASVALALEAHHVFLELSKVRPFLVLVMVNGQMPPVCGWCVLFGTQPML